MDQPEEVQKEDGADMKELQRQAALAFVQFKLEIVATFDTDSALDILGVIADNPEGVEDWLNDQIDVCYKYLGKARAARRKKPRAQTYKREHMMVDCLSRLTTIREQWLDFFSRFEEGSLTPEVIADLDYYR